MTQAPLWGEDEGPPALVEPVKGNSINPCLQVYGAGPPGRQCGDCAHLYLRIRAGRYYKCEVRRDSGGPATDHRVRWPSCSRFIEREGSRRTVYLD